MTPFSDTDRADRERKEQFFAELDVPNDISRILDRASSLRRRMEETLHPPSKDKFTVITHHILRAQQAVLAHLTATDPQANFKVPQRWDNELGAPDDEMTWMSRTIERCVNYFIKRGKLLGSLNAMAREAYTTRAGWLKVIWEGDKFRTPNGARIMDPKRRQQIMWQALKAQFDADEFDTDSVQYAAMKDAEVSVRQQLIDQYVQELRARYAGNFDNMLVMRENPASDPAVTRLFELLYEDAAPSIDEIEAVPSLYQFSFDVIMLEDMRVDFQIGCPEHYKRSARFKHRMSMTRNSIIATYDVPPEAWRALSEETPSGTQYSANDIQDGKDSSGNATRGDTGDHDVWEIWDADTGMVYTCTEAVDGWLRKIPWGAYDEPPFFLFTVNDIAGSLYGPSMVELLWDLQTELNDIRRHQRMNRIAAMPKLLAPSGSLSVEEIAKYESAAPFSIIFVERLEDLRKDLLPLQGAPYYPQMYDRQDVLMDFQMASGMPSAGLGATNTSNLATEVAFAREELNTQLQRMSFAFNSMLGDVCMLMARIITRALPIENIRVIAGEAAAAMWPADPDVRENLLLDLVLDVKANASGKPDRARELDHIGKAANIMAQHGAQLEATWMLSKLAEIEDTGIDWQNALRMQGAMPAPSGQHGPTPGGPSGQTRAGDRVPTGANPGPAPGTPTGGFQNTPQVSELPGSAQG